MVICIAKFAELVTFPFSPVIIMRNLKNLDLSPGAIIYCQRTGKQCEVLKHFAYSRIDHVVVAFDITESTPRHVALSVSAAKDRFASSSSASVRTINFFPKSLVS